ncbi:MAG: NAD(P)/FAD-dependent oxidoreductase [Chloroflexota bacterium]
MSQSADVIIVGAGVQGASLAFHLAHRGAKVLVLERETMASGATGKSCGLVRMHYDLESDARLAWTSFPYYEHWDDVVGAGDAGFVRRGFLQLVPPPLSEALRHNVAMMQGVGIEVDVVSPAEVAELFPGCQTDDIEVAAYEPRSGYADPSGTTTGFLTAARQRGARLEQGCAVESVLLEGDHVIGVATSKGTYQAPVVVNAAGPWAKQLAGSVGLDIPIQIWRHDTAYFGLPEGRGVDWPVVIDHAREVYFRPEGQNQMLVGLEVANEIGGSPDRPFGAMSAEVSELMVERVCERVPWMVDGTLRSAQIGQDGLTPDQRPILDRAGPEGFYLACGLSGTGFKTAPAQGLGMAELILDGTSSTIDISAYVLDRFAQGRLLEGEHTYGHIWS